MPLKKATDEGLSWLEGRRAAEEEEDDEEEEEDEETARSPFLEKGSSLKGSGLGVGKKLSCEEKGFSGERLGWGLRTEEEEEAVKGLPFTQFWLLSISVDRSISRMSWGSCSG